ncbi:hypothetical protein APHACPA_1707 [Rickettsia amblyommatis str. Ac/Pa]|uniref:Uncharacterized protein n=1 Tax=Rickettsia amblyommatis str. Ac/Pa TaxID=1359164 RepID=A0A0F3N3L2_RICAM|nr:hypothetical protein APHACPA_1707 [Rickettsia amblyommatis str. Ac/Pa]
MRATARSVAISGIVPDISLSTPMASSRNDEKKRHTQQCWSSHGATFIFSFDY